MSTKHHPKQIIAMAICVWTKFFEMANELYQYPQNRYPILKETCSG